MEEEKRKAVRIKKTLVVQYSKDKNFWDMTFVKDISGSGIQLTSVDYLAPNETLILRIKFPSKPFEWLEVKGKVVDCIALTGRHAVRIEFVDLEEEQKRLINEYVSWFISKYGGGK